MEGIIVEPYYSVTQADADAYNNNFGGGSFPLLAGMNVYRVYVDMAPNYKLNTVFGSPVGGGGVSPNPLDVSTTTTFWNDDNFGADIPGQTRRLDEGTAFDSYITVNSTGTAGGAAGCGSAAAQVGVLRTADTNGNLTLCTAYLGFTGADGNIPGTAPALTYNIGGLINFSALTGNGSVFQVINDAWATLPNSTGVDPTGTNRVLIGQFTTNGTFSFHLNVQLSSPTSVLETYVWNQAGAGEVVSPLLTYPAPCVAAQITSATSNSPICSLDPLNLSVVATGTAPLSYTWTGVGTITNGGTANASVTGAATGNYNIAVSNACGNVNQNVAVVVNTATNWYADTDGDGFGAGAATLACAQPVGSVANNTDLCPADPLKQAPGACGCGVADVAVTYYADVDGDGFGDPANSQAGFSCSVPNGFVTNSTDNCPAVVGVIGSACNDGNPNTNNDVLNASCVCVGTPVTAITGCSSSQSPYVLPIGAGRTTTSILTVGDAIGGYQMVGIPDGMGAFDNNDGTFSLLVNHELGNTLGAVRAHGSIGAFVSKWVINKSNLCVQSGSDLVTSVLVWNGTSFTTGTTAFARLCSADLPPVSAFYNAGTGKGTQTRIFMNGEETGAEGRAFGHIASGPNAGLSSQLPWLGRFSWENSLASPTASDKTVVIGTDDATPGQVYVYIGTKTTTGNDFDKAGLNNGKLFGVKVTGLPAEISGSVPAANTPFSLFDLGNVTNITGAALNTASNTAGVTNFLRPEDGAWDPSNPNDFYFVTTNSFTAPSRMWLLRFTDILQPELGGTITAVLDGTEAAGQKMMDNMCVDQLGQAFIQEDPGNQAYQARIHKYDILTDVLTPVATSDPARFVTGAPNFLTLDEETSGIIDMQDILGKGRYLLNMQAHYGLPSPLIEGGQILELRTGDTTNVCVPPTIASITSAQTICSADTLELAAAFNGTPSLSYSWSGTGTYLFGSGNANALVTGAASGVYTVTVSNACGSATGTVNVTVTPTTSNTTTISACDTYTWAVNGQTYTASGTYTSVTGCATEILALTITPSTSNTTTISACDTYTWAVNGTIYTASGTYTSVTGCATEILVLTITGTSSTNTTTISACDTYTWAVNGTTYTASGTYTNVSGCNTEILVLTITPSTSNTTTITACDTYTWAVNGTTYTASGTYTSVTGCATEILALTITPSTSNTTTISACDTYTWAVNGQTYTASGTYTSVTGCATEILVLTITRNQQHEHDHDQRLRYPTGL
ncbi:MAG: DUF839 domain-containing protein [Flavobacteriales bacterium]|nr:DUF839 domain-containing protein [Flavobacteriales bacterium]